MHYNSQYIAFNVPPHFTEFRMLSDFICSINNSSSLVDQAIDQAQETRQALDRQKKILQKGSSGLSQLLGNFPTCFATVCMIGKLIHFCIIVLLFVGLFPAANNFINKIRTKKQRDQIILASVVALCVLFCVWWVFG